MFMRKLILSTLAITFLTLLVPVQVQAGSFKRIVTEQEFRSLVVGKRWQAGDNYFIMRKNGKISGEAGGEAVKGAWAWRDGFFCRTLSTHSKDTDCQVMSISGSQVQIIRKRGKGETQTMTLK